MPNLDIRQASSGLVGPLVWGLASIIVFGFLWFHSAPPAAIRNELRAAGPDGVTAYFRTPEAAVSQINQMLAERNWVRLARYYDFTGSSVTKREITSGTYFLGETPVPPEPAGPRPFPQGYRYLATEPSELPGIVRVLVVGEFAAPGDATSGRTLSFMMMRMPEGYRIVPVEPPVNVTPGDVVP